MAKIILIQDLISVRERREQELLFYSKRLDELNKKLFFVKKDIDLTETIIRLIERDKIQDLRRLLE